MTEVVVFPDATLAVVNGLRSALTARSDAATVGTIVPSGGRSVTVNRSGGGGRRSIVIEDTVLTIDCRDDLAEHATALAQLCRGIIGAMPGTGAVLSVVDHDLSDDHDLVTDGPLTKFAIQIAMRGAAA